MLYFSYNKERRKKKMKKYNLSEIMKNAWAMFRKGGRLFADCLRKAWAIAKQPAKKQFDGNANIDGFEFNLWEKYGKRRIYINNYSGRNKSNQGGYIDLDCGNSVHAVGCVKSAAERFILTYDFH